MDAESICEELFIVNRIWMNCTILIKILRKNTKNTAKVRKNTYYVFVLSTLYLTFVLPPAC